MVGVLETVTTQQEQFNIVLLTGVAIFGGTVGARLFKKLRIPQIVGYVAVGIVLGPVLNIISEKTVADLQPFNLFALGIIGFLIGSELKRKIFVNLGRQVLSILLFEGLAACFLVGVLSFAAMLLFSGWQTGLAVSVVFGAICAATDPASTVNVLWEYKARGPLTTMLTAIVALDDALALVLYAIGVSIASVIIGHQGSGLLPALGYSLYEIAASLGIGFGAGLVLSRILNRTDDPEKVLVVTLSAALLIVGTAIHQDLDVIIATMALGATLTNIKRVRPATSFGLVQRFAAPVYVLFFVLVGARLRVGHLSGFIWLLVGVYVIGSILGKTGGAYLGGLYSGAPRTVRNYLGFCLYPQGGIAVGLLIMASHRFESEVSSIMLVVVIAGAFILQLVGPIGVKMGAGKAGELGLNITEEDLMRMYKVGDVMTTSFPAIQAGTPLSEVIEVVSSTDNSYYPVVDKDQKLAGMITLDAMRSTFATQELNDWLVALDLMEPVVTTLSPDAPLSEGLEQVKRFEAEQIPVLDSGKGGRLVGVLEGRTVQRRLKAEVLAKQQKAYST